MPNKDKNIPKRRFKEFENADAWELRKLGDTVIEIIAGGDIDKNKVVEFGKYPIYANSHSGDGIVGYYDDFYRVNGPAVTVTGRGEVGFAKARETDFTPVVRLLAIRSKHNHCFLENAINLHGVTVESTGVPQLTVPQLSAYRIYFPYDIQEENQIGTFFSTLDQQITLHQRKLDKLKSVKQAYLSEMFPAEGERVPKRRFPGFTDAWELRKLNNIADVRDGTHNSPRYIEFGYTLVTSKNIKNGQVNFEDIQYISSFDYEEINKRSKVNINDILMGMIGTVGNLALVREEPKFAIKNVALIKNIGVINVEFLYHYLGSYVIERQLQNSLDGGTQKFISLNKIRHLDITFPTLPEQEAIGTFFSTLDSQITLHQRKLEKLKNLKKALLNELFV
ncbi:restriction endonuclease subunit S [Streptococcus suis]